MEKISKNRSLCLLCKIIITSKYWNETAEENFKPKVIVNQYSPVTTAGNSFWNWSIFQCFISPTAQQNISAATVLNNECQNGGVVYIKNVDFMFNASISD